MSAAAEAGERSAADAGAARGQEEGRPFGRPSATSGVSRKVPRAERPYLPLQVRTMLPVALVPSAKTPVALAWSLPSGHFAIRTPFLLIVRLNVFTEPAPLAIFGIVATDLRP